jgi:hypothetical protein
MGKKKKVRGRNSSTQGFFNLEKYESLLPAGEKKE